MKSFQIYFGIFNYMINVINKIINEVCHIKLVAIIFNFKYIPYGLQ